MSIRLARASRPPQLVRWGLRRRARPHDPGSPQPAARRPTSRFPSAPLRAAHTLGRALALSTLLAAAGCSDEDPVVADSTPIVGPFTLRAIGGEALPYELGAIANGGMLRRVSLESGRLSFSAHGGVLVHLRQSSRAAGGEGSEIGEHVLPGQYTRSGSEVSFCLDPRCGQRQGNISPGLTGTLSAGVLTTQSFITGVAGQFRFQRD